MWMASLEIAYLDDKLAWLNPSPYGLVDLRAAKLLLLEE
jgi:hypothetical protein